MLTQELLRPELEPLPARMRSLRVHRGYPTPWFVGLIDGIPEFRCMDTAKWRRAVRDKLCWVCGEKLGKHLVFVAGPMCGVNRTSAEPPCHLECAQWSARNCPFLSKPQMTRRENAIPEHLHKVGTMPFEITRNPGVTLLWITTSYSLFGTGEVVLIRMGEPERVEWYALGKPATREQVEESVASGLPALEAMARQQDGAMAALTQMAADFKKLYPRLEAV